MEDVDIPTETVGPMENFSEEWLSARERDLHMRKRALDSKMGVISEELMWVTRALTKKRGALPAQKQVQTRDEDGALHFFDTVSKAFEYAYATPSVWKISWTDSETEERIRMVRVDRGGWEFSPILPDELEELRELWVRTQASSERR